MKNVYFKFIALQHATVLFAESLKKHEYRRNPLATFSRQNVLKDSYLNKLLFASNKRIISIMFALHSRFKIHKLLKNLFQTFT